MPMSPDITTGIKSSRLTPHSCMIEGIARPISCPSNPSRTIDSAASSTPSFWNPVHGPLSMLSPTSTIVGEISDSFTLPWYPLVQIRHLRLHVHVDQERARSLPRAREHARDVFGALDLLRVASDALCQCDEIETRQIEPRRVPDLQHLSERA